MTVNLDKLGDMSLPIGLGNVSEAHVGEAYVENGGRSYEHLNGQSGANLSDESYGRKDSAKGEITALTTAVFDSDSKQKGDARKISVMGLVATGSKSGSEVSGETEISDEEGKQTDKTSDTEQSSAETVEVGGTTGVAFEDCFPEQASARLTKVWKNPWSHDYQVLLSEKLSEKQSELSHFPPLQYPNAGHESLPDLFNPDEKVSLNPDEKVPEKKVLLFGYGSLINEKSAKKSMSEETFNSIKPVAAFGLQRVFDYKASKTDHWGANQNELEKAMLNLKPTDSYEDAVNGVTFEVNAKDLSELVKREKGYDLVPILVADWDDVSHENPSVAIKVVYTFIASSEPREGNVYTSSKHYPVRGYLEAIQEGAMRFGEQYRDFWNRTTYLADATTEVTKWDKSTFTGILPGDAESLVCRK